jgi:DNA-binding protein HU-beta
MNLIGKEHYMALTKDQLIADITLPGIGKLKVTERPARTGRNPSTGAAIEIAAKKVIKLVVAKGLTDAINK